MDKFDVAKFNFNEGDIVITTDNKVGYVTHICHCDRCKEHGFDELVVLYLDGEEYCVTDGEAKRGFPSFKQIGTYKFEDEKVENHKRLIERLHYFVLDNNKIYNASKKFPPFDEKLTIPNIIDKLNEVIDKLNEME